MLNFWEGNLLETIYIYIISQSARCLEDDDFPATSKPGVLVGDVIGFSGKGRKVTWCFVNS